MKLRVAFGGTALAALALVAALSVLSPTMQRTTTEPAYEVELGMQSDGALARRQKDIEWGIQVPPQHGMFPTTERDWRSGRKLYDGTSRVSMRVVATPGDGDTECAMRFFRRGAGVPFRTIIQSGRLDGELSVAYCTTGPKGALGYFEPSRGLVSGVR
jgi:hypothetical protein